MIVVAASFSLSEETNFSYGEAMKVLREELSTLKSGLLVTMTSLVFLLLCFDCLPNLLWKQLLTLL